MTRVWSIAIGHFDRWIHGFLPVTAEGLALSRIFFAAYFLLTGIPTFSWIGGNPPGFFNPPPLSVAAFFAGFPARAWFVALDLAICVLLILVFAGFMTRTSSILLSLAWIFGNSFRYSFGKIDHSIIALVTPMVMAFSGWGAAWSIDAKRGKTSNVVAWPLSMLALLLSFGFFSAGWPKLAWADFDLGTHGARGWLVGGWYGLERNKLLAPFFMQVYNPYFWEVMDLTAVAFEIGFIFTLARREMFRAFLFVAVMFHFANLLMLNIGFLTLIPVYVVFLPWERLLHRVPRSITDLASRLTSYRGIVVLAVLFLPLYLIGGSVPVDTAANLFSHLGIAAESMGFAGYSWVMEVTVFTIAVLITLWIAGLPHARRANTVSFASAGKRVVFFDGVCNLCNGFVDFVIQRNGGRTFRFASLQSPLAETVAPIAAAARSSRSDSIALLEGGNVYDKSDAILKILPALGGGYRVLAFLWLVPRPVRDLFYRTASSMRYTLFGKRSHCRVPTPGERYLFL